MNQITLRRPAGGGSIAIVLAGLLSVLVLGCTDEPISPSQVTGPRILGLRPDPPQPAPGDELRLDLLWTDTRPYCEGREECDEGQRCENGRCVRESNDVEMIWIVTSLSAWQSEDTGFLSLLDDNAETPEPSEEECATLRGLYEQCALATCLPFGSSIICCGDALASEVNFTVPDIEVPPDTCSEQSSLDFSQILQVQVQICLGGQLDFCDIDRESISFGCVGTGAETLIATSRVQLASPGAEVNTAPVIDDPTWGQVPDEDDEITPPDPVPWVEGETLVIQGCQGNDCANRSCRNEDDCLPEQVCEDSRCREELSLAMIGGAQETYLRACDESPSCEEDDDCESGFICNDGSCERVENPVAAFYASGGALTPGRVVLDTTGNGRPDEERFTTNWIPPTLDPCEQVGDFCSFGTCDPALRLCTGEVSFWVVARDGRGGQDWIERQVMIVP